MRRWFLRVLRGRVSPTIWDGRAAVVIYTYGFGLVAYARVEGAGGEDTGLHEAGPTEGCAAQTK